MFILLREAHCSLEKLSLTSWKVYLLEYDFLEQSQGSPIVFMGHSNILRLVSSISQFVISLTMNKTTMFGEVWLKGAHDGIYNI